MYLTWYSVNSQTDRLVDRPTRRQNVVLVDKKKSQLVDTKSQLVDTKKPTRRHPKNQLVDTQKTNSQTKYIVATGPNNKELEIYFFYFKGLKLSYFQIFLVQFYQVLYTQRDLNDAVDETKSFDVIYHPPSSTFYSMRLIELNSCQLE